MGKDIIERRKCKRLLLFAPVRYKESDTDSNWKTAESNDIGKGGISLNMIGPLDIDTIIRVLVYVERDKAPIDVVCKTVYCRTIKEGGFRSHLKFIEIHDEYRLFEYIYPSK